MGYGSEDNMDPAEAMEKASAVLLLLLLLRWALASGTYRDIDELTSSSTGLTTVNDEHAYTFICANQTTTDQKTDRTSRGASRRQGAMRHHRQILMHSRGARDVM